MESISAGALAALLDHLKKKLTNGQLLDLFPDEDPDSIRGLLGQSAQILSEKENPDAHLQTESGPTHAMLTLFTDGASRGNPGEAGAGITIQDDRGREIYGNGFYLGQCTNNMAEYQALILGLQEAVKLGGKQIAVKLDSELIVKQINGRYKVKDVKLKPLFDKAMKLLTSFDSFEVAHVRRAENRRADQLANEGVDTKRPYGNS